MLLKQTTYQIFTTMQLTAKLTQVLPAETGMGKNGEWKKQSIIVETEGQYPKKVCITAWGDKLSPSQLQQGNILTIDFDIESREFNGRWYTDLRAWKVESAASAPMQYGPAPSAPLPEIPANYNTSEPPPAAPAPDFNDLPF
ncbi:MAG: hypothetical protein EZS26_000649 [Candidatus Ordinivivax streblomastigis]|uniref:DUF3127 domain-containing protein n=1 Tax=Candidatus Ordinivivax streblomastigis TaxID=2540710 RepID=A0A5M8P3Z5_9BACT|nr:MAG: hypothetical protein EZS26_000649 [Candidatus Ordinivivax streblomastigis]